VSSQLNPRDVAQDSVAAGEPVALPTLGSLLDGVAGFLLQAASLGKSHVGLVAEFVRIVLGRSDVAPTSGDWRFEDPT
jgi:hypothetical protein